MKLVRTLAVTLALAAGTATPLVAQLVGNPPGGSPFHDMPWKQELTVFGGRFGGSVGGAAVGPRSAPLFGIRYGIRLGGPVEFDAHLDNAFAKRLALNPDAPLATRDLGTVKQTYYVATAGLTFNLTGQKTWHRLIPTLGGGIGVVGQYGAQTDTGGYHPGTSFALTFGGGLRYVPGGNWGLRLEASDVLFQLSYPPSYFRPATIDVPPVLSSTKATSEWTHHLVLRLGLSYLFSR